MKENKYQREVSPINSALITVQDKEGRWGAIDKDGNVIIAFGKYEWIDGFQNGLARVIAFEDQEPINNGSFFSKLKSFGCGQKGGIINEVGEEVLPTKYNVWRFYGKSFSTIKYYEGNEEHTISYKDLNPLLYDSRIDCRREDYGTHYGEYAGTYAQDVAGYSDDVIGDAFDGEPDAYWNID